MLQLMTLQCAGVWISTWLPFTLTQFYTYVTDSKYIHFRHAQNPTLAGPCETCKSGSVSMHVSTEIKNRKLCVPAINDLSATGIEMYKVVQIWPGLFVCKQVTVCPGNIWTTLYLPFMHVNYYTARCSIQVTLFGAHSCRM
jgi:hypothetical protein